MNGDYGTAVDHVKRRPSGLLCRIGPVRYETVVTTWVVCVFTWSACDGHEDPAILSDTISCLRRESGISRDWQ